MKKKVTCIIDFGQTHLKFILLTENLLVTRILIFKNNFKYYYKKTVYYNSKKIERTLKVKLDKISKIYNITSISCVSHGSACFFLNKDNFLKNGLHFSSKFGKKLSFSKFKPSFNETYTPDFKNLHNLGKNFYMLKNQNKDFKFMTMPSYFGWLFSKKNIIDRTYLSCHSYLWNFNNNNFSSLVRNINGLKNMPNVKKSGSFIGLLKNSNFKINKNCRVYNGMHDTSSAFSFHKNFFKDKNSLFLSTGTTFVLGYFMNGLIKLKENEKFYFMSGININNNILCKRFNGGLMYNSLPINNRDKLLSNFTMKEINIFLKKIIKNKINLVIDGPFSKKKNF